MQSNFIWMIGSYHHGILKKEMTMMWKRMVTKATFVGPGFTRKPPKYKQFIQLNGLRSTKAYVTFKLDIISVKKDPNGPMYTSLGIMTTGSRVRS